MDQIKRFLWPIAIAGGVLVIALIALSAWILPEGHKVSAANAQNATLLSQETALQAQIAGLEHESKNEPANCSTLRQDETLVPGSPTVDAFLHQISQLATNVGTQTPSVGIGSSTGAATSTGGAQTVQITLSVSGTYQQALNFLKGLDNPQSLTRLYSVSSANLSSGGSSGSSTATYTLNIVGNIYYTTGQQDVCSTSPTSPASSST
jgi:hypothetical protein